MAKHQVHHVRTVSPSAYVLRLDRKDMTFRPGQYITLGREGSLELREYSIYSSRHDPFLEVLIKEVEHGSVSKDLKKCQRNEILEVDGPFGYFVVEEATFSQHKFIFIASGTGIAPFHSFVRTYHGVDYLLLHGIRAETETYDRQTYATDRYVACVSGKEGGDYQGRVTAYLKEHRVDPRALCYLCGNSNMIFEAFDILRSRGVPGNRLFAEVYF